MTPSEKKASEIEAKRLLDLLGLIDMGITFLEQEQEAVSILAPALDAAERRGFERAKRMAVDAFNKQEAQVGHFNYFGNVLYDLKYEDTHDEA